MTCKTLQIIIGPAYDFLVQIICQQTTVTKNGFVGRHDEWITSFVPKNFIVLANISAFLFDIVLQVPNIDCISLW